MPASPQSLWVARKVSKQLGATQLVQLEQRNPRKAMQSMQLNTAHAAQRNSCEPDDVLLQITSGLN